MEVPSCHQVVDVLALRSAAIPNRRHAGTSSLCRGRCPVDDVSPLDRIDACRGGSVSEDRLKMIA